MDDPAAARLSSRQDVRSCVRAVAFPYPRKFWELPLWEGWMCIIHNAVFGVSVLYHILNVQ